jgi:hypothetical protein
MPGLATHHPRVWSTPNLVFLPHTYNKNSGVDLSTTHSTKYVQYLAGGVLSLSTKPTLTTPSLTSILTATALPTFLPYQALWAVGTNYTKFDVPSLFKSGFNNANQFWWCNSQSLPCCHWSLGLHWGNFPTTQDWSSLWTNIQPYQDMVSTWIASTNGPSTDNQRYLNQTFAIVGGFLTKNRHTNLYWKDHMFGQSKYTVASGLNSCPIATYLQSTQVHPNFKMLTRQLSRLSHATMCRPPACAQTVTD